MTLDRKQEFNDLYHICVFRADRKTKIAALANGGTLYSGARYVAFFVPGLIHIYHHYITIKFK